MDKHNNPSKNINNSNDNPWEYQVNEVENTQEIPVVSDESPRGNGDSNTHSAPEYAPSTYAPETEQKSHIGRNLFIGAVAVAAVAGAVVMFSGNQTNATRPNESAVAPATQEQKKYTGGYKYIGAEDESTIDTTTPLEPDTEKIQEYKEAEPYQDGLTVQEFANSQGFDAVADAYNYQGEDIRYSLKSIVGEMGYGLNSASCTTTSDGKPVISVGGTFDFSSGNISRGMIGVTYDPDGNNFYIQLSVIPTTGDYVAEFSSDTIPTLDEARQILADNL